MFCSLSYGQLFLGSGVTKEDSYKEIGVMFDLSEDLRLIGKVRETGRDSNIDALVYYNLKDGVWGIGPIGGITLYNDHRAINNSAHIITGVFNSFEFHEQLKFYVPLQVYLEGEYRAVWSIGAGVGVKF